jgi:predicted nucleotidyltransferase
MSFDPRPYAEHYRMLNAAEAKAIRERVVVAREEAQNLAARILESDSSVTSVILFGSLAEGSARHKDFDIDLAIDGGDLYKALEITEESPFDVDIVRLDLLPDHLRARVKTRGVVLASVSVRE